ncbi:MAG: prepilin peptidase [Clostridiales bacterium]|nr:prepilin peptidase [Clostridiales bacterium]
MAIDSPSKKKEGGSIHLFVFTASFILGAASFRLYEELAGLPAKTEKNRRLQRAAVGASFGAATYPLFLMHGISFSFFINFALAACLLICSLVDLKRFLIPNAAVIPCFCIIFTLKAFSSFMLASFEPLAFALIGATAGLAMLLPFAALGAMGMGDVKLMALVGLALGPLDALFCLFLSTVFGTAACLVLLGLKMKTLRSRIQFGPFISAGALCVMLFGEKLHLLIDAVYSV